MIKAAAVARGQFAGNSSGVQGEALTVQVPKYIAELSNYNCFATRSNETPACSPPIGTESNPVPADTSAGNYNPVYYVIVGLGSLGLTGEPALYAMRLISSWLAAFFLAAIFYAAASMRRSPYILVASTVAVTPAVLFLTGSVNPNALEIGTAGAFYMGLCLMLEQRARPQPNLLAAVIVTASGVLLSNTRPLSFLWIAVALAAALLGNNLSSIRKVLTTRSFQLSAFFVGLSCIFALWWSITARSLDSLFAGTLPVPADEAALLMLDRTFESMREYVGVLGSLDTEPPTAVVYTWVIAFGSLLLLAFSARPKRLRWPVALLALAVLVIPPALQAASSERLGLIWQGRYALALVVMLMLAAGVAVRFRPFRVTPWAASIIRWSIVLGVAAHTYLMLEGFRRYTVGIHGDHVNWSEMFDPEWQPPFSWQGLTVAYIVILSVAGVCLYRLLTTRQTPALSGRTTSER
ncbi:DUF2142 domain-containing protein [Pseudarthrobacter sp. NIBRBAC000502772]|uniref:DUF2142 domain-containing protein n=1 Tax=Pseudarthrobacter sp. NIBRBAC000502772 TaxID=2590775 RepID=UPI001FF04B70|nr:DUF2142 domain-containing protein [Pseudarthrobacter sp. NIBRBAC000502772]